MRYLWEARENLFSYMRHSAILGLREYCDDNYVPDGYTVHELIPEYSSYTEAFSILSESIKSGIALGHEEMVLAYLADYKRLFDHANFDYAKLIFDNLVDRNQKELGMNLMDAQVSAIEEIWKDPNFRRVLPFQILLKDERGRKVHLIADEHAIPQEGNYVTISELEHLKKSDNQDPWRFILNRKKEAI